MRQALSYRHHAHAVLWLGLPLVGSHVAQFAVTLTDAVMLGWYSVEALAAETLGGTMFFVFFIMGSGFAWAVMPIAGPGILPALLVMVLKSYLAALERTQVVLWVTVAAVGLNIAVNHALIFGNWGLPELGVRGAAIASLVVHTGSFAALVVYAARATPEHTLFQRLWRPDREAFARVFRLGWPIGITNLAEVGLFAAATAMLGWLGTLPLAAHGIAMQVTSVVFMVHLGLSNVATIRAGQAFGRGDGAGLRAGAIVVLAVSGAVALATVVLFLTVPEVLIGLFLNPAEPDRAGVIAVGTGLLAAAALFQLVDAGQVLALGLLRGVQDTRVPMVIAALSYWAVGVPASYALGFSQGLGGVGVWLGLAVGLACAAVFMLARFWGWSARGVAEGAG